MKCLIFFTQTLIYRVPITKNWQVSSEKKIQYGMRERNFEANTGSNKCPTNFQLFLIECQFFERTGTILLHMLPYVHWSPTKIKPPNAAVSQNEYHSPSWTLVSLINVGYGINVGGRILSNIDMRRVWNKCRVSHFFSGKLFSKEFKMIKNYNICTLIIHCFSFQKI